MPFFLPVSEVVACVVGHSQGGKQTGSLLTHARVEWTGGTVGVARTNYGGSLSRSASVLPRVPTSVSAEWKSENSALAAYHLHGLLSFYRHAVEQRHQYRNYGGGNAHLLPAEVVADTPAVHLPFARVSARLSFVRVFPTHGSRNTSPFRATRIRRGLTLAQVAARARVHVNTIRKIENGTSREVTKYFIR